MPNWQIAVVPHFPAPPDYFPIVLSCLTWEQARDELANVREQLFKQAESLSGNARENLLKLRDHLELKEGWDADAILIKADRGEIPFRLLRPEALLTT